MPPALFNTQEQKNSGNHNTGYKLYSHSLVLSLIHSKYLRLPPVMGKEITSGTLKKEEVRSM